MNPEFPTTKLIEIMCVGRGSDGRGVLEKPINVVIKLSRPYLKKPNDIEVVPKNCPFFTGGHRQRCKASHPDSDKVGTGVACPYSFDWPYVLENNTDWKVPTELVDIMEEVKAS